MPLPKPGIMYPSRLIFSPHLKTNPLSKLSDLDCEIIISWLRRFGFGPRFLHSTGQLHKGDAGNGLFIQITTDPIEDTAIPDDPGAASSSMTFGTLIMAQALGDGQALMDENRRFIRFHVSAEDIKNLAGLVSTL